MNIEIRNRAFQQLALPADLRFDVLSYDRDVRGGPRNATIRVTGPRRTLLQLSAWLRYDVTIRDSIRRRQWWGYVHTVTLASAAGRFGLTLDDCANRIAVVWSDDGGSGGVTEWLEDADSIAEFGVKELLDSASGVDETAALAKRGRELARRRHPTQQRELGQGEEESVLLECRGYYDTLSWRYYRREEGLVEYPSSRGAAQKLGWGFVSNEVAFTARNQNVSQLHSRFNSLVKGEKFRIAGSAANDGVYTVESSSQRERQTYTASTIAFLQKEQNVSNDRIRASIDAPRRLNHANLKSGSVTVTNEAQDTTYTESTDYTIDYGEGTLTALSGGAISANQVLLVDYIYTEYRIEDTDLKLGFVDAHDIVRVSGAANGGNNGYFRVLGAGSEGDYVTVKEAVIDEEPGASVTIARGSNIAVEEALANELPGASVTVTAYGRYVAQSFQIPSDDAWTVDRVEVRLRKVGNPAYGVRCALCTDALGAPHTLLEAVDLAAASIAAGACWIVFPFANTTVLSPGTTYWIRLEMGAAGNLDTDGYYEVIVDEDAGYTGGLLRLYDGVNWVARPVDASLPFRILGRESMTDQVRKIVEASGQFLTGCDLLGESDIETNQYRDGRTTALTELEDLLALDHLLATVTDGRKLRLEAEPERPRTPDYYWEADGTITDKWAQPLVDGDLRFVGQWMGLRNAQTMAGGFMVDLGPFFVEWAEYDAETGVVTPHPRYGPTLGRMEVG